MDAVETLGIFAVRARFAAEAIGDAAVALRKISDLQCLTLMVARNGHFRSSDQPHTITLHLSVFFFLYANGVGLLLSAREIARAHHRVVVCKQWRNERRVAFLREVIQREHQY